MGKKVLAIVLSSILVCLNIISVEAKENYEEQSMTVTEDFIKQAEVEVSNQGYLKSGIFKINENKYLWKKIRQYYTKGGRGFSIST